MKGTKLWVVGILALSLTACTEANIEKVNSKPSPSAAATSEGKSAAPSASAEDKESQTSEAPKTEIYNLGDSIKFDDMVITVNGVRESKSQIFTPDEGNIIILVDVTAENKGDAEENISSMLQTEVVDGDGFNYNLTIVDDAKGSFDGTVAAGRKLRGEIAYQVPKDASLEFIFKQPFKSGQAIWKLK
ncbi:DUF4352 domain-containing protein [Cohnella boryungensis]|uniref:DUF4352 domain-containing protein n=1 Tax=Cohnella boryungensis TaxID=768479 RepID=A0ABV8SDS2_9BACL